MRERLHYYHSLLHKDAVERGRTCYRDGRIWNVKRNSSAWVALTGISQCPQAGGFGTSGHGGWKQVLFGNKLQVLECGVEIAVGFWS